MGGTAARYAAGSSAHALSLRSSLESATGDKDAALLVGGSVDRANHADGGLSLASVRAYNHSSFHAITEILYYAL